MAGHRCSAALFRIAAVSFALATVAALAVVGGYSRLDWLRAVASAPLPSPAQPQPQPQQQQPHTVRELQATVEGVTPLEFNCTTGSLSDDCTLSGVTLDLAHHDTPVAIHVAGSLTLVGSKVSWSPCGGSPCEQDLFVTVGGAVIMQGSTINVPTLNLTAASMHLDNTSSIDATALGPLSLVGGIGTGKGAWPASHLAARLQGDL